MLKKIEKVKDFSFIRKGPIITETFSIKFKAILPPPPKTSQQTCTETLSPPPSIQYFLAYF